MNEGAAAVEPVEQAGGRPVVATTVGSGFRTLLYKELLRSRHCSTF